MTAISIEPASRGLSRRRSLLGIGVRIGKRLVSGFIVVVVAVSLAFIAIHLAPGDIQDILIGPEVEPRPEVVDAVIAKWGLDRTFIEQYFNYLWNVAHGDFGTSYIYSKEVSSLIASQIGHTVALASFSFVLALVIGFSSALLTAGRPKTSRVVQFVELVLISSPGFWLGLLLIIVVSYRLRWLPATGAGSFEHLILPGLTMALGLGSYIAQVLRGELERAANQPFTVSVRARGVSEFRLKFRHLLRHASLPVVTMLGWVIGSMLGGAVIIETLFARPGLGQLASNAVLLKDVPVILAVMVIATVAFVVASTLVDIAYLIIDPRLRFPRAEAA